MLELVEVASGTGHIRRNDHAVAVASEFVEVIGGDGASQRAIGEGDTGADREDLDGEVLGDLAAHGDDELDQAGSVGEGVEHLEAAAEVGAVIDDGPDFGGGGDGPVRAEAGDEARRDGAGDGEIEAAWGGIRVLGEEDGGIALDAGFGGQEGSRGR